MVASPKVGKVVRFTYSGKERVLYVQKTDYTTFGGHELTDNSQYKNFRYDSVTGAIEQLQHAELPVEAGAYSNAIFSKMLSTNDFTKYELNDSKIVKLIGVSNGNDIFVRYSTKKLTFSKNGIEVNFPLVNGKLPCSLNVFIDELKRNL